VRQLVSFQAVLSAHQTTRGSNLTIYPVTAISAEKAAWTHRDVRRGGRRRGGLANAWIIAKRIRN
jgi:predicted nucleic acid-binding protein